MTELNKIPFLNIQIDNIAYWDFIKNLQKGFIVTPNVDHLVILQKDIELYEVYQNADYVICDSRIIYFLSKLTKYPIKNTIPGSSFFPDFCKYHANNNKIKIFLLGAAEGVAQKAMSRLNKKIDRKIVVGAHSPSFGFEKNEKECQHIIQMINESDANVLLVGVGAPKQEKWINKYKSQLHKIDIFLPLGATIDFEAGQIKRAPKLLQKIGLEWFFRILQDPKRLSKRYLVKDPVFFLLFIKQILGLYKNPFKT